MSYGDYNPAFVFKYMNSLNNLNELRKGTKCEAMPSILSLFLNDV